MIKNSQCEFVKNKSCQTNLIPFSDRITGIWYNGRGASDVIYLDFSKDFDTVSHDILNKYSSGETPMRQMQNWWENCTQRVFIHIWLSK